MAVSNVELNDLMAEMGNLNVQLKEAFTLILPRFVSRIGNGMIRG